MPINHPWQPHESSELAIRHLVKGDIVALPTEATYELVCSALHPEAVARLRGLAPAELPAIVLGDYANLFDWLPLLGGAGRRLFRKMGPGPIKLCADAGFAHGLFARLPEASRRLLVQNGQIAVRWPAHPIWDELRHANLPLIAIPLETMTNDVACMIDAGPTQFGVSPSIVQTEGRRYRVLHEGALNRAQIDELAQCRILFICTGNTCRSPMAEVLCAKFLAEEMGCLPTELEGRGFCVHSAGLAALMGSEASPDAVRVVADVGADLSNHRSRMASMEMLLWADHLFAMTAAHAYSLAPLAEIPGPRLLSPQGDDVADPMGGELADYRACAQQIIQCLKQRLPELLES